MSASPDVSPSACLGLVSPSAPGGSSGGIDRDEASLDPSSSSIPSFVSCGPVLKVPLLDSSRPATASSPGVSLASSALFPEDPVARALDYPVKNVLADASRIVKFDADWEFSLLPASGAASFPVTGEGRSLPDRETDAAIVSNLRPYQAASLYPVRPPCGKTQVSQKTTAASIQTVMDFRSVSFPPLPKSGGLSNSLKPSPSPTPVVSPGSRPVGLPGRVPADASAPGTDKISWASLVSDTPAVMELSYFKPTVQSFDGRFRCSLPSAVAINGTAAWENTIVGFFLDKLPFSLVNTQAHRLWDANGLSEVLCNGNGFFFFKFRDKAMSLDILNGGPWYFGGRPIFLKAWKPGMNLSKEGCKRVPIWAHFRNVPLEFWTAEGLSHIASIVGIPLHADKMTSSLKRLSYARICIEIGFDDPLPNSLDLVMENGNLVEIQIEYNWVPKKCSTCMEFGHLPIKCKKLSRQTWVPKAAPLSPKPISGVDLNLQSRSGVEVPASSASLPVLGSLNIQKACGGLCSGSIIPKVAPSGSGSGGCSSSNTFAILQVNDDDLAERREGASAHRISAAGVPVPTTLDESNCLSPISKVGPVVCSSLEGSPIGSGVQSSPSSFSSTPLLARRLNMVDELEKKQGKQIKHKKKSRSAGNSKGKFSLISND